MNKKYYKGFDRNMQCRGFQFKEGETYHEDSAELCHCGFHACEAPIDVLNYYAPGNGSIYREVELDELCDKKGDDTKVCGKTIKIGAEIGIPGLVKAQIEWVKEQIEYDKAIEKADKSPDEHATGYQGAASATGDQGAASATGNRGAASATGKACAAMASGIDGKVMGAVGCAIFAVEREEWNGETYPIVDGEIIKANTWYRCKDGQFVEVEEED